VFPRVQLVNTGPTVPVDHGAKQMLVDASGAWSFSHLNDAETQSSRWLLAETDGTKSTSITHSATTHSFVPNATQLKCTLDVAGDTKSDSVTLEGPGCYYPGSSGSGTPNAIAFKWTSPHMYGRVDNVVDMIVANASDARLKGNIETVTPQDARKFLECVRATFYSPADHTTTEGVQISRESDKRICGGIAQELEECFPQLVNSPADGGLKSFHTEGILFMTISALQEVDRDIKLLKDRIKVLEDK
jgi:hypothetical protein